MYKARLLSAAWAVMCVGGVQAQAVDFHPPKPYVAEDLYRQAKASCPSKQWDCYENKLFAFTMTYGPRGAVDAFKLLKDRADIPATVDAHHFVHHVGHHTAMAFGTNSQAFALCPTDFHYGCFHGFFQQALGLGATSEKVATKICEDLEKDPTIMPETRFSCYHGLGHGVMMFEKWELQPALNVCDQLKSPTGRNGCYQGVFMESVNQAEEGKWWKGHFSTADPLAPCNALDSKYAHECYINHFGWLARFYSRDLVKATRACLNAGPFVDDCLSSIGLAMTNPSWQVSVLPPGTDPGKTAQNAWSLCQKFPEGHQLQCLLPGVDNLMHTNNLDAATAQTLCALADASLRTACYRQIGINFRSLTPNLQTAQNGCRALNGVARVKCLEGVGL